MDTDPIDQIVPRASYRELLFAVRLEAGLTLLRRDVGALSRATFARSMLRLVRRASFDETVYGNRPVVEFVSLGKHGRLR